MSAVESVSAPVEEKDEVADWPKSAVLPAITVPNIFVVVAFVAVRPPLKFKSVVVALLVKGYAKFA